MCETDVIILSYSYEANLPANQMNPNAHIGQVLADRNLTLHPPTQELTVQDGNPPSIEWGHSSTPFGKSYLNVHGDSSDTDGENRTGGGSTVSNNLDTGSLSSSADGTGGGKTTTTSQPIHFHSIVAVVFITF